MPLDNCSVLKAFLLLTFVIIVGAYTAFHLLHTQYSNLDSAMTQEDLVYFKDGVLSEDITAKGPVYKKEVKRDSPRDETTTIMSTLDSSFHDDVLTDYNLDYSTTPTATRQTDTVTDSNESKGPSLPIATIAMVTTTPMVPASDVTKQGEASTQGDDVKQDQSSKSASLKPPKGSSYQPSPAPSSPPTRWTSNKQIYTTPEIQKLAQEYFNSVTMTTSEPARKKGFSTTPGTSPTPTRMGLDSTKTNEEPKTTKPKYTSYKIPTTTTLPPPCFRQPYKLSEVCTLEEPQILAKGPNVTLEDLAKMVFLKSTLGSLKDKCVPGVWCIEEDLELQNIINEYLPFCSLRDCLLKMPDECLNEERRLVLSTLFLFCEAHHENVTDECMFAVRKMAHVTMTDIYRSKFRRNENTCRSLIEKNECNGTCLQNAQNLHCMHTVCNYSTDMFKEFDQWSWFFSLDDAETKCQLNTTDCMLFQMEVLYETWWNQLLKANSFLGSLRDIDIKVLVGLVCAVMATMAGLAVLLWACIKRRQLTYAREKVEYTEVKDGLLDLHGDEVIDFHDDWDVDDEDDHTGLMNKVKG